MRSFRVAAVVVAVVFGATACPATPPPKPSVVLVGDSISNGSSDQLNAVFGLLFPWNFSMYAEGGFSVTMMRSAIRDRAAFRPDVMVIALGTNDIGEVTENRPDTATALTRYAEVVRQMQGAMDDLAGIRCVVWIDVNTWSQLPDRAYDLRTWGPVYNARLRQEAAARRNVHVVDYADQILAEGPAWRAAHFDGWGIHPETVEAKQTVAAIMAQGVRQHCGI